MEHIAIDFTKHMPHEIVGIPDERARELLHTAQLICGSNHQVANLMDVVAKTAHDETELLFLAFVVGSIRNHLTGGVLWEKS